MLEVLPLKFYTPGNQIPASWWAAKTSATTAPFVAFRSAKGPARDVVLLHRPLGCAVTVFVATGLQELRGIWKKFGKIAQPPGGSPMALAF
jgi:hypothetical protein